MVWINYDIFIDRWLERAERGRVFVDDGDRFISLWIAFNGWMKGKFGEGKRDEDLLAEVKALEDIKGVFSDLKRNNLCFSEDLIKLREYPVADMRHINNAQRTRKYDGTFE